MTRTEREPASGGQGPNDRSLDLAAQDPDFAEYYDDAPTGAPAVLRAPTPLAGVPAVRPPEQPRPVSRPDQPKPAIPAGRPTPTRGPEVDSPFLGLFPNAAPPALNPPAAIGPGPSAARPAGGPGGPVPGKQVARRQGGPPERRSAQPPVRRSPPPPARRSAPPRSPRPEYKDKDPVAELVITEIAGHLTFTPTYVTAWYWLPEVRWAFRPDADREALIVAISEQYAGLAGFRLHLRRTSRPFAADEWARVLDQNTSRPLPDVPGAPSWGDHLVAAQRHLLSMNHAEGQTFLGISFARRTLGDTFAERFGRLFRRGSGDAERRRWARMVEQFDEVLGAFGMRGRRVTAAELEWLLYRSVALGMAPPSVLSGSAHGGWAQGDLLALTEQIERFRSPYGSTTRLMNRLTGEEKHVAVLTVGRMEPLEIPERHEPWLHFHERLPWPIEIVVPGRRAGSR